MLSSALLLYFLDAQLEVTGNGLHWFIISGIVLAVVSAFIGTFRVTHRNDGKGREMKKAEAFMALSILNIYLAMFLVSMPR